MKKWKYNEKYINSIEDCPKESIGFVYKITNKENDSYYIKKLRKLVRRKLMKFIKEGVVKKLKKLLKQNRIF